MTIWEKTVTSLNAHDCLTHRNPVIQKLEQKLLSTEAVPGILSQYYCLVRLIVQFLASAADRLSDWEPVRNELRRNLGEELGSRTDGELHQTILRKLFRVEFGWNVTEPGQSWNRTTKEFLVEKLLHNFWHNRSLDFVAGMVYALEASARPELLCVAKIINFYAGQEEFIKILLITDPNQVAELKKLKKANRDWSLELFIGIHVVDFEVGHATELESALRRIDPIAEEFEAGFEFVLNAMDTWWEALACGE